MQGRPPRGRASPRRTAPADVVLPDGRPAWIDGGPATPARTLADAVVHSESVELGSLAVVPPAGRPGADLAPDQLAAVAHRSGPARVIAPAGSGKTRVLTERLRHLLVDRGYEPATVLAVAYNKQAQLEMEARTAAFRPRVRTLNSLGLWVLAEHRGGSPPVLDEPDVRRMVDALLPGRRQRRANTDPIGPYLEGLTAIRLGPAPTPTSSRRRATTSPASPSCSRPIRHRLAERGAVDFDEQIYARRRGAAARRAVPPLDAALLPAPARRRVPGPHAGPRPAAAPARPARPSTCSASATTTSASTATPAPTRRSSSTTASCSRAPRAHPLHRQLPLPGRRSSPAPAPCSATTTAASPRRSSAGPAADPTAGALRVVEHGPDDGAAALVERAAASGSTSRASSRRRSPCWPASTRCCSPPTSRCTRPGCRSTSVLRPEVLERTGMRAALAYLRIATSPDGLRPGDVVEILRRPTRGLPQWFPDRLERRTRVDARPARGDRRPGAGQGGRQGAAPRRRPPRRRRRRPRTAPTRDVLEAVRDDVGLGAAMSLLDRTGGGQGSSHLDDLDGLLGVADLHPDPAGFEPWLRAAFQREADPAGVTLSTIHRVKGREWDRVAVFGVADGLVPHRLAEDVEEERRVLHVGDHPRPPPRRPARRPHPPRRRSSPSWPAPRRRTPDRRPHDRRRRCRPRRPAATGAAPAADGIAAARGARHHACRAATRARSRRPTAGRRSSGYVIGRRCCGSRFGERVEHDGRRAAARRADPAVGRRPPRPRPRCGRGGRKRAGADGVPAYVVVNDKHLRGIALARPATPAELVACDGIGPAKLERYGDEILAVLEALP